MSDNPFLLPPGGGKPNAAPPAVARPDTAPPAVAPPVRPQAAPDAAPAPDQSHYIAVPASVESATHRVARPAQEVAAAEPLAEDTRVAPPHRWALLLPDGARVGLDGPLLLGRDPAGIPDRPDAGLLPVADSGKTVSKTHALLEPGPGGVRVRELHSTNGVAIDTAAGRQVLGAGGAAVAPSGATVMLGSFAIRIAN